jgi:hypothetical protein
MKCSANQNVNIASIGHSSNLEIYPRITARLVSILSPDNPANNTSCFRAIPAAPIKTFYSSMVANHKEVFESNYWFPDFSHIGDYAMNAQQQQTYLGYVMAKNRYISG